MLATCRSLHEAGYDVAAASFTSLAPTQWSRACKWRPHILDVCVDADLFVEQLREELTRRSYAALIPGSDAALLAISSRRERLEPLTALGLPAPSAIERAFSRQSLAEAAGPAGLIPAESILCTGLEQAAVAADKLGFPVVLKSATIASADEHGAVGAPKGQIAPTEAHLEQAASAFHDPFLIQRYVRGNVLSFGGVMAQGHLLSVSVARYQRMWPPESGSVTFGETISSPPELEEMVSRLLVAIGWEGIFELELIRLGPRSFVPIDLNPRPYGSMALANAAGAPLAAVWCDWLLTRGSSPLRARPGVRYRWEDGDLRHLRWQLQRGNYRLAAEPLRPHRRVIHAHYRNTDPLPLLARGIYLARKITPTTGGRRLLAKL
jgi:predicted ATP-grasp superfamily ATP-dependent carboligase